MAHKIWEGKYNSDFALQVTSNTAKFQEKAAQFTNNNLNGHSRFFENKISLNRLAELLRLSYEETKDKVAEIKKFLDEKNKR